MYDVEGEEFLGGAGGVVEEVIEEYRLDDFTKVRIVKDVAGDIKYIIDAPEPSDEDEVIIEAVRRWFIEEYPTSDLVPEKMAIVLEDVTARLARKFLKKKFRSSVPKDIIARLQYIVKRDIIGFGKLDPLLKDPNIEDIHILGIGRPVYVWHTRYENIPTNIYFIDPTDLDRHLQKLMISSGKFVSLSRPIIDGTLPMGYRVHVVHKVISELGTTITIRKYREVPFTIVDLVKLGTIFPELVGLLWVAMENKRSVFIVGETASGKTTLLNAIASLIPLNMKVVTVEEVREIRLPHPNVVYMTTREGTETAGNVTLYDLIKASMRQRPDYIIVGEIRGEEAYVLLQAISLGHGGLCTMHAEGPASALKRLMAPPMNIPPYLVKLLDIIIHITKVRLKPGVRRYVLTAAEIVDINLETKEPTLNYIYRVVIDELLGAKLSKFLPEESLTLRKISEIRGLTRESLINKVWARANFIAELTKRKLGYEEVMREITNYRD